MKKSHFNRTPLYHFENLKQVKIKDIKQLIQKTSSHIADYMETSAKTQPEDPAKLFKRAAQIALFGLGEVQETSEWFQKSRLLKNCLCVCS